MSRRLEELRHRRDQHQRSAIQRAHVQFPALGRLKWEATHQTLSGLGGAGPTPAPGPLVPAVPVRRSVQPDYVVCLECGFHAKTLRRHLRMHHGLEVGAYRTRWRLPSDHPTTAPAYSERRLAMAKQLGLGRKPAPVEPSPAPRRRGRRAQPAAE
jgi:predicted transcriptional regulator